MMLYRILLISSLFQWLRTGRGQEACGPSTCSEDEECCNESCGICVPKGDGACTQQYCYPTFFPFACFPGSSTVKILGRGLALLKEVQVGDRIETVGGTFQQVYAFGHYDQTSETNYLQITTDNGHILKATGKHLVFLEILTNPIPAEQVQIGDLLRTENGPAKVVDIVHASGEGVYAPFTTDGTLMIDGVAASCYVSMQELEELPWIQSYVAFLSHIALAPFRSFCVATASKACQQYNEHGISKYSAFLFRLWKLAFQKTSLWVLLGTYLAAAVATAILEVVVSSLQCFLVAVAVIPAVVLVAWMRWKKKNSTMY